MEQEQLVMLAYLVKEQTLFFLLLALLVEVMGQMTRGLLEQVVLVEVHLIRAVHQALAIKVDIRQ